MHGVSQDKSDKATKSGQNHPRLLVSPDFPGCWSGGFYFIYFYLFIYLFIYLFWPCLRHLGQGLNPSHSNDNNARSLTAKPPGDSEVTYLNNVAQRHVSFFP